jgi:hypothetical protein
VEVKDEKSLKTLSAIKPKAEMSSFKITYFGLAETDNHSKIIYFCAAERSHPLNVDLALCPHPNPRQTFISMRT